MSGPVTSEASQQMAELELRASSPLDDQQHAAPEAQEVPPPAVERSSSMTFEHFPLEIRLQIYCELLVLNFPVHVFQGYPTWAWCILPKPNLDVSIMRTNKRVHAEAAGVLYGDNVFILQDDYDADGMEHQHIQFYPRIVKYMGLMKRIISYEWYGGVWSIRSVFMLSAFPLDEIWTNDFYLAATPPHRRLVLDEADVRNYYAELNMDIDNLVLFGINFRDQPTAAANHRVNQEWLTPVDTRLLACMEPWIPKCFPFSCGTWLVSHNSMRALRYFERRNRG